MIVPRASLLYRQLPGRASADPFAEAGPSGLSVRMVHLEGGTRRTPHRHPHSPEVIYVLSGSGVLWENGGTSRFQEGDCALIHSGMAHATIPDAGTEMELVCFFPHPDLGANTEELEGIVIVDGQAEGNGA